VTKRRWVQPNSDKPHRCPECHLIAERARSGGHGPKTVMTCPGECGVQWRHGGRQVRT
jgi:hypothetical protein